MTEEEWQAATDPTPMLEFLHGKMSDRKLRLFGVACCRVLKRWLPHPRVSKALDAAVRYADGQLTDETLSKWGREVYKVREEHAQTAGRTNPEATAYYAVMGLMNPHRYSRWRNVCEEILRFRNDFGPEAAYDLRNSIRELLRDVFGNPFRPVTLDVIWLTSTVVALAKQVYDTSDFSAMPILADALQDAGCDNDSILTHCRDTNATHVRGCWVIDLLTGRE